jgi:hypothetical protein
LICIRHEQFMHRAGKIFQQDLCLVGTGLRNNTFVPTLSTAIIPRVGVHSFPEFVDNSFLRLLIKFSVVHTARDY